MSKMKLQKLKLNVTLLLTICTVAKYVYGVVNRLTGVGSLTN